MFILFGCLFVFKNSDDSGFLLCNEFVIITTEKNKQKPNWTDSWLRYERIFNEIFTECENINSWWMNEMMIINDDRKGVDLLNQQP